MTVESVNNLFVSNDRPPRLPWPPLFLPRMRDPRPRCVLVIGDGFTQSFLHAIGVAKDIRCTTGDLIPAPQHVQYLPTEGDQLSGPLWDSEKWPLLHKFWRHHGELSGWQFFRNLRSELPINPTVRADAWTFSTPSLAYEVRAYLWHFFRAIDRAIDAAFSSPGHSDVSGWEWRIPLYTLKSEFVLDVVSFNYDLIIDRLLPLHPIQPILNPLEDELDRYPSGTTFLSKPHGSIMHNLYAYFPPALNLHPNNWLQKYEMRSSLIQRRLTTYGWCPREVQDKTLSYFPTVPDLVPPGRQGDDICSPGALQCATRYPHELLSAARAVVVCGLSGSPPDDKEVAGLLAAIPKDAVRIHVGIAENGDKDSVVANCLRSGTESLYFFLEPNELIKLHQILSDYFPFQYDWPQPVNPLNPNLTPPT
jgi:hypothetical protein